MSYRITLRIPGLPETTNQATRGKLRHRLRAKREWKRLVWLLLREQGGPRVPAVPLKRAHVTCIRHSSFEPDHDGIVSSFKHIIDGLVEAGVLENDKKINIGIPVYDWQPAPPKQGFCLVTVEEIV